MTWAFESGLEPFWGNLGDNSNVATTSRPHAGTMSLEVTASSTDPASVGVIPCFDSTSSGSFDLRGRRFTAFIFVPTSPGSSFAGTSCRLGAYDPTFVRPSLGAASAVAPIVPGSYFQLTGIFPTTTLEAHIYEIFIECTLPTDWLISDTSKDWFIDDVRID